MIKLGANTVLFAGYDLETALKHISWAGYDGAELSAIKGMCEHLDLDRWRTQAADIKALAETYELSLTAMEVASLNEERLLLAYEAAAGLGIPVVNVGPGGKAGSDEDLAAQIDLLAKMSDKAHAHGVRLCVKAHVGQSIHDTPTTLKALAQIDSPGFGIDMDPSHIFRADGGEDVVAALRAVVSRMGHVHIRDCPAASRGTEGPPGPPEQQACGRGGIDLAGYLRVLHEAGIDIAVNLEVIGAREYELSRVATIAAESRGYLHACLKAVGAR
ncbi:MAG: sugar phosphate isomerase/epimerase [bacterium]|nr:sugar phosphate isomerase/epimerase [bacterium]